MQRFITNGRLAHRAWWSSVALFLVHGLVVATWFSRIPEVQTRLGLSNGALGLTLLGTAFGSVLTIPFCGFLVTRFGSRPVAVLSTFGFCLALPVVAMASSAPALFAALFLFGATGATMDVSMNVQGVEVEQALARPTMSRFHAMFSIGGMAGAGLGGFAASRGLTTATHFMVAAPLCAGLAACFAGGLLHLHEPGGRARPHEPGGRASPHGLRLRAMPASLLAASSIAFCMLLSEGAIADWTGVYLRQTLLAGPGTAAAGYAVFSAAMAIFRLLGDHITLRLGNRRTVRTFSLLAGSGVLWAIASPGPMWALPGFAAAGAGFSVIVPVAFGAGGRVPNVSPGAGVATVTGLGYLGFLAGPPAIGFTAQATTLRAGLGLVALFCVATSLLARWLAESELESNTRSARTAPVTAS